HHPDVKSPDQQSLQIVTLMSSTSSTFIPLVPDLQPSSDASRRSTACFNGGAPGDGEFTALVPGDASAVPVPRPARPEAAAVHTHAHAHDRLPVVTLKRQDDKITRIQVRCSCGEVI